jgi:hypothetical protein
VFEGSGPIQAGTKDALQVGFCGGLGSPERKSPQKMIYRNRGHGLGESMSRHVALDSYIGKMFKKERRKWDFLAE